MISDFMDENSYSNSLKMAAKRHDVVGMHIYDEFEASIPNIGVMEVVDVETGEEAYLDTSDPRVRALHTEQFNEKKENFEQIFRRSGASIINMRTDESYVDTLHKFFKKRAK